MQYSRTINMRVILSYIANKAEYPKILRLNHFSQLHNVEFACLTAITLTIFFHWARPLTNPTLAIIISALKMQGFYTVINILNTHSKPAFRCLGSIYIPKLRQDAVRRQTWKFRITYINKWFGLLSAANTPQHNTTKNSHSNLFSFI